MRVLVSVNSVQEAQLVLSSGVTLIDLKDTTRGALAALPLEISKDIIATIDAYRLQHAGAQVTVSGTVGDDCEDAAQLHALIASRVQAGVEIIKLPEALWDHTQFAAVIAAFVQQGVRFVAVFKPESLRQPVPLAQRLAALVAQGYIGVMVDTVDKSAPVLERVALAEIQHFVRLAKQSELMAGVAGGLRQSHLPLLANIEADYLGFRGGLCRHGLRTSSLEPAIVAEVVSTVEYLLQK